MLRRRSPRGDSDPINGVNDLPTVIDTRQGLGGGSSDGGFGGPPEPTPHPKVPNPLDPNFSRGGETPRERPTPKPGGGEVPGSTAAPPMPSYPAPQAGSSAPATGGSTDQMPSFSPLPSAPMGMLTSSRRSLYGKAGGLLGGGLGAQDTTSNNMSDPISSLIQLLQQKMGGGRGGY